MTKQQEIREEITRVMERWTAHNYPIGSQTFSDLANQIFSYLHSRDVVIVDRERELPENPYLLDYDKLPNEFQKEATGEDVYLMAHNGFERGKRAMLKAGYIAVEPLIKE